jgi:predicted amidohydrolase
MKDIVRAAAAQIEIESLKPEANLARVVEAIERIAQKVDLIVFAELVNSGHVIGQESKDFTKFAQEYLKVAEKIPGLYTDTLGGLARKHNLYIVIGLLEAHPCIPATLYNSAVLIGPSGRVIGVHHKAHIPREEKHYFYPGNSAEVFSTELGNIGLLVCADVNYPEFPRVLTLKGAEIICVSYCRPKGMAGGDPDFSFRAISCRAFENNNFFVTCSRVGREGDVVFEGRSCICGPQGEFLARSEVETEDIITADLSAEALQTARMRFSRFRDRRPDLYGLLCQPL